jgi:hypothetical protein
MSVKVRFIFCGDGHMLAVVAAPRAEKRAFRIVGRDPRRSVTCAAVTLHARFSAIGDRATRIATSASMRSSPPCDLYS